VLPNDYENHIREIHRPFEVLRRVKREDREIFVGALSRINNNQVKLSPVAKKLIKDSKIEFPNYNSFYNVFAQIVEIVHCIEESGKYLKKVIGNKYSKGLKKYQVRDGKGGAMIEAPRGALYHYYELDKKGVVKYSNIITPTAQFISNIEQDIKSFYPDIHKESDAEKTRKIRMLIRAYDPCMTCTVH
jgi:coenzyme F420-reducing hydrogenase alpha subunit